jgi:tight adherence protein C
MEISVVIASGLGLIIIGFIFLFISYRWSKMDDVSQRINMFVTQTELKYQRRSPLLEFRNRELTGSLGRRVLLPTFQRIIRLLGRLTPAKGLEELDRQLQAANNPFGLGPREFYGLRIGFTSLGFVGIYIVLLRLGINQIGIILALLSFLLISYFPKIWLLRKTRARQDEIRSGLPDALDMLSVCASAGLGFDQALQRVSEYWHTPVGVEFNKLVTEMELGLSRKDALHNLAERLEVTEMTSFVSLLIQSEQLGMSIADTLLAQSGQMRTERRFKALEEIRKVPIKMLFPMTFLILPAIFAIILGPAVPALIDFFNNF